MEQDDAALLRFGLIWVDHRRTDNEIDKRIVTELGRQQAGRMLIWQELMSV